jgi:hypothetical protein
MRIADLLRQFADIVDQAEQPDSTSGELSPLSKGDDVNRFKQVMDLISQEQNTEYENEPAEQYAGIEAVTTDAGGGMNGPKHPHDLRVKDPSQHPGQQEY